MKYFMLFDRKIFRNGIKTTLSQKKKRWCNTLHKKDEWRLGLICFIHLDLVLPLFSLLIQVPERPSLSRLAERLLFSRDLDRFLCFLFFDRSRSFARLRLTGELERLRDLDLPMTTFLKNKCKIQVKLQSFIKIYF